MSASLRGWSTASCLRPAPESQRTDCDKKSGGAQAVGRAPPGKSGSLAEGQPLSLGEERADTPLDEGVREVEEAAARATLVERAQDDVTAALGRVAGESVALAGVEGAAVEEGIDRRATERRLLVGRLVLAQGQLRAAGERR